MRKAHFVKKIFAAFAVMICWSVPSIADTPRPDGWTYTPLPTTKCLFSGSMATLWHDAPTSSDEIVIYVQGGGSCYSSADCHRNEPANPTGYKLKQFRDEPKLATYPYLSITDERNPFKLMNKAMIPYCTGDLHTGQGPIMDGTETLNFTGDANFKAAIGYLLNTKYPNVNKVWLLGTSAGGAGAAYQYEYVRSLVQGRGSSPWKVYLIEDSSPGVPEPIHDADRLAAWGTQFKCPSGNSHCGSLQGQRLYNRSLSPGFRYAFMSFSWDRVTSGGLSPTDFFSTVDGYMDEVEAINPGKTRRFYADNTLFANYLDCLKTHVVTTADGPPNLAEEHIAFVRAMVTDTAWTSQTYPLTDCAVSVGD